MYAANSSWLGALVGSETAIPGGIYQKAANGTIFWRTGAAQAYYVYGAIADFALANPGAGFPTAHQPRPAAAVMAVEFTTGRVVTSSAGTFLVWGGVGARYRQLGAESGQLGFPTSAMTCGIRDGGCYQNFASGAILWSSASGAFESVGAIRGRYQFMGFENSLLGFPTSPEVCGIRDGGCYQNFQGGAILWSPATGAVENWGGIRTRYDQLGFENSRLGFPTGAMVCGIRDGGCYQNFQGGAILWSPASGAFESVGAIRGRYGQLGFENGRLGFPTSPEVCGIRDGGCYQNFQGGAIVWSPASGAFESVGSIRGLWAASGFEGGVHGYPTSGEYVANGIIYQNYQNGQAMWTAANGATWAGNLDPRCMTAGRVLCASKTDRKLRYVVNGVVVATLDARFGDPYYPTPEGIYTVYYKNPNIYSQLYNVYMPWSMCFSGDNCVHYSVEFYNIGYAGTSHGCVNVRDYDLLHWIYDQVQLGDRVVVYW